MIRDFVMLHHSLTKDGQTVSWQAIRRYHMEVKQFADVGYHAGVELVNDHLEALFGRPETERAAACKEANMNELALHVCCVGNFDLAPPSEELIRVLARYVVKPWLVRYGLPVGRIVGHRDYAPYKTCPGSQFDLEAVRAACR